MANLPDSSTTSGTSAPTSGAAAARGSRPGLRRPVLVAVAVVATGLLVALAMLAGWGLGSSGDDVPGDSSVDAGFARDMQVHHHQAVDMAVLMRDRTDDETLRTIALDIVLTQQQQAGQMYGWLEQWGLPQTSTEPVMEWMGMGGMPMAGLASDADLQRLRDADGVAAERLFLELMIDHHHGGVHMAEHAAEEASQPEVRKLAESMASAQTAEINALEELLDQRAS